MPTFAPLALLRGLLCTRTACWQLLSTARRRGKVVGVTTASSPRRLGAEDSKTRAQLLDAAEQLMLEEGYAAVTSRRVAAKAGIKPQLVHYYFRTMDDLFLEVFRRRAEQSVARSSRAMAADRSLRTLWQFGADLGGATFNIEFVALANHRKAIRDEIASYAERFRDAARGDHRGLGEHGIPADVCRPSSCCWR